MTDELIQVPQSLLKLERMRAKNAAFFGAVRELSDRVNQLHGWLIELHRNKAELERFIPASAPQMHAPGTRTESDRIEALKRTIAAATAMKEVAQSALDEHKEKEDEARLYQSMKSHLMGELLAWGLE
jgi:hypothetical protein